MSRLRVEFSSPESGAYIHEMTDDLKVTFVDCDDREYEFKLWVNPDSDERIGPTLDFDLQYPDGQVIGLESVVLPREES